MSLVRSFIVLTGATVLGACATEAPAPAPAPPPVVAAHTVSSHPDVPNNLKIPSGYTHSVAKDGTDVYCRNDLITGSRTEHETVCLTAAQLQAQQAEAAGFSEGVQSHAAGAAGAGR